VRDGLAVKGVGHGHERADVGDHRAHHEGQAQRGNGTARHFADEGLFIPGRIEVGEQRQLDGPIADGIGQDLSGFLVFFLQCDDAALGTGGLHQLTERPDDFVGVVKHVMLVGVQKGLAFAAVGDNRVGVGGVLDVRRKTSSTFTNDTGRFHRRYERLFIHAILSLPKTVRQPRRVSAPRHCPESQFTAKA